MCFRCGTIKHNQTTCSNASSGGGNQQYGVWLKAPTARESDWLYKKYGEGAAHEGLAHSQPWRDEREDTDDP